MIEEEVLKKIEETLKGYSVTLSLRVKKGLGVYRCKECGQYILGVKRKGAENTYCSKKCKTRHYNKRYQPKKYFHGRTFFCKMCGAKVEVKGGADKRRKFCSKLCSYRYVKYMKAKNKDLVYDRFFEAKEKAQK